MFPTKISTRARLWARSPAMATAGAAAAPPPPPPRRGLSTARASPPPTAAPLLRLMKVRPSPWAPISLPPAPRRGFPAADMASAGRILADEEEEEEGPVAMELEPIGSEQQLDRALAEAQQLGQPIVVLWMASWCRKCIYLKPKLEKMAADYYPRIRFYCVDVNAVPQKLVNRAGVTKMPAIQLWSDSQKQAEVVGGQKAWLVIDDVRKMIEQDE